MDKKQLHVTIRYTLADGRIVHVDVKPTIAAALDESDHKLLALRKQDQRHLDSAGYIDGQTEHSMRQKQEDAADLVARLDEYARLYQALNRLTETQRRRTVAYFFEGHTLRVIARRENVSHRAIASSIREALNNLKKMLERPFTNHP